LGLRSFIAKRVVYSVILIIAVICINFVLFMVMPGDPTDFLLQGYSRESPEQRQAREKLLRDLWGIGDPWHVQLIKYMRNLFTWNFGIEIIGRRPIAEVMARKIPYTLLVLGTSTVLSIVIGVLLGIEVIKRRGSLFDTGSVVVSLILSSLPTFWIGLVLLWVFSQYLGWFPGAHAFPTEWAGGKWPVPVVTTPAYSVNALTYNIQISISESWKLVWGYISHLILPLATLTIFSFGGWLLLTRASMLDVITEDYIVTARAKGLSETTVLYRHALKNAALPIVTSAALSFGFILSGAIITETVFSYPGIGGWIWDAINFRDYTVLMAIFYVISICVIVANIIADILYGVLDPRIRYE